MVHFRTKMVRVELVGMQNTPDSHTWHQQYFEYSSMGSLKRGKGDDTGAVQLNHNVQPRRKF